LPDTGYIVPGRFLFRQVSSQGSEISSEKRGAIYQKKNFLDTAYSIHHTWEEIKGFCSSRSAVRNPIEHEREGGCQWISTKDENLLTKNDDDSPQETVPAVAAKIARTKCRSWESIDQVMARKVDLEGMMHRTYCIRGDLQVGR
jgi:hypothetical protein